jgi:heme-degrading monooxygenase HmoA
MPDDTTAAHGSRRGQVAVIFAAWRTCVDEAGYASAAAAMDALAATQPGYRGIDAARESDGFGITVSYWADEASAVAWREHPEHAAVREAGRGRWYDGYDLHVTHVSRSYGWRRTGKGQA